MDLFLLFLSDLKTHYIVRDTLAKGVVQKYGNSQTCSDPRSPHLSLQQQQQHRSDDVWEFDLLLPSSRRRLDPDNRQVTVWSPYRQLTFNEDLLRQFVLACWLRVPLRLKVCAAKCFMDDTRQWSKALTEWKCRKASVGMRMTARLRLKHF